MASDIMIQQNVVYKTEKGTLVTDSLKVAKVFGKRHDNVLKSIRDICRPQNVGEQIEQSKWFYKSSYIDANGVKRPMVTGKGKEYFINKFLFKQQKGQVL